MTKIVIMAPRGHMDSLIVASAARREGIQIVGGVGTPGRDYIGQDIGLVAGLGYEVGAKVYGNLEDVIDECELVIDFSTVELSMKTLEICLAHKKAYICGTTGFTEEQTEKLLAAGEVIPMMKAANTSFVVNVMRKILGEVAEKLGSKCHIDVIDMHSWNKPDAPSG
ncbi:MAG: 4-hydroxy-tetrahydrodipicolinate reductase, partial [Firmicutes bacterium]|nr:4-hydroxy-tetrahydrodipicolinate reductase [Bacillota bacterium]